MIVQFWGGPRHNEWIDMGEDWPGSRPPDHFRVIEYRKLDSYRAEEVNPLTYLDEIDSQIVPYPLVGFHPTEPGVLIYRHPNYPVSALGRKVDVE